MSDERQTSAKEIGRRFWGFLAVLPLLYVLSIGPAIRWCKQNDSYRLLQFYAPLDAFCAAAPTPVGTAIQRYMELWVEE